MANNYEIPKNLTRKDRRKHIRKLTSMAKRLKIRWEKMEEWYKTLSKEDVEAATNFQHEDVEINKKFRALADTEQTIVYYLKLIKKLENYETKKPIVKNADSRPVPALRAG